MYQKHIDKSGDHKHFTMIPHALYNLNLHPYAIAIYGLIKRRAGSSEDGIFFMSAPRASKQLGISKMTYLKYRERLVVAGLIDIQLVTDEDNAHRAIITLTDKLWEYNRAMYGVGGTADGLPPVQQVDSPSPADGLKEETVKNKPIKKNPPTPRKRKHLTADEVLESTPIPANLVTHKDFLATWFEFIEHRIEIDKPITVRGAKMQLKKLEGYDAGVAISALQDSVANGWQGVFPDKNNGRGGDTGRVSKHTTARDQQHGVLKDMLIKDYGGNDG